jgi:two-component system, OmpR family, phosphate regulon sensor histidine kinase PhoR
MIRRIQRPHQRRSPSALRSSLHLSPSRSCDPFERLLQHVPQILRSPLAVIQGYLESFDSGLLRTGDQQRRAIQVMGKHSHRMAEYLDDLTTLTTLTSRDLRLKRTEFSPRRLVEDVIEHLAPALKQKNAVVLMQLSGDLPMVFGDRYHWDLVFTHLLQQLLNVSSGEAPVIRIAGEGVRRCCLISLFTQASIPPQEPPQLASCKRCRITEDLPSPADLSLAIIHRGIRQQGGSIEVSQISTGAITRISIPNRHS